MYEVCGLIIEHEIHVLCFMKIVQQGMIKFYTPADQRKAVFGWTVL